MMQDGWGRSKERRAVQKFPMTAEGLANVEAIAALLPPDRPFRFVDLGCGFGGVLSGLSARFPRGEFTGCEIAPLQSRRRNACAETTPLARFALDADGSLVILDNGLGDGQAQAAAAEGGLADRDVLAREGLAERLAPQLPLDALRRVRRDRDLVEVQ